MAAIISGTPLPPPPMDDDFDQAVAQQFMAGGLPFHSVREVVTDSIIPTSQASYIKNADGTLTLVTPIFGYGNPDTKKKPMSMVPQYISPEQKRREREAWERQCREQAEVRRANRKAAAIRRRDRWIAFNTWLAREFEVAEMCLAIQRRRP